MGLQPKSPIPSLRPSPAFGSRKHGEDAEKKRKEGRWKEMNKNCGVLSCQALAITFILFFVSSSCLILVLSTSWFFFLLLLLLLLHTPTFTRSFAYVSLLVHSNRLARPITVAWMENNEVGGDQTVVKEALARVDDVEEQVRACCRLSLGAFSFVPWGVLQCYCASMPWSNQALHYLFSSSHTALSKSF